MGASSLLGYTISMFARNETDDWTNVVVRTKELNHTQYGLYSGITYYFIVRAENSHGISIPSEMSEAIRVEINRNEFNLYLNEARASLLSGDVVELVNATSNDSTSIKLSWKVRIYFILSYFYKIIIKFVFYYKQIINGRYVEGLYIYAKPINDENNNYKMTTILNAGSATSCTLTGLMRYTKYEIFVIPFYKTVEGKPSNMIETQTIEDGE